MFRRTVSLVRLFFLFYLLAGARTGRAQEHGWGSTWRESRSERDKVALNLEKMIGNEVRAKDYGAAERHLADLLKQFPQAPGTRRFAAAVHTVMHRYPAALQDCEAALGLVSDLAPSASGEIYTQRAGVYFAMKDFAASRGEMERALRTNRKNPIFNNNLAWLLATCPEARERDASLALRYAKLACEGSSDRDGSFIDTLAAAEAESGQFDKAIEDERRAMTSLKDNRLVEAGKRLRIYQSHQPFRDAPSASAVQVPSE